MLRKLALAAVVALGGLVGSASVPAPAQAQVFIGVGGPGYGYGHHRRYRGYDDGYYGRRYDRRSYYRGYGRDRYCTLEKRRVWNGYRYERVRVRVCR